MPDGSVWYNFGTLSESKPIMRLDTPKGRTPPDWVYFCWIPAIYLVMYSMETGSSTVKRCDWHSILARFTKTRASAVNPAKARATWSSNIMIFLTVRGSWSFWTVFFSTPKTTTSFPRTPTFFYVSLFKYIVFLTAHVPFLTASNAFAPLALTRVQLFGNHHKHDSTLNRRDLRTKMSDFHVGKGFLPYSTWNKCPSGEKTVKARSYDILYIRNVVVYEVSIKMAWSAGWCVRAMEWWGAIKSCFPSCSENMNSSWYCLRNSTLLFSSKKSL